MREDSAKQNLIVRSNMKCHLVTIIVEANVYCILEMCQVVFQVLYGCSLNNDLLRWVLLSPCPFYRYENKARKVNELAQVYATSK